MRPAPCILTIAGSDSGGGAGIQADLKTMAMLGTFGMSVITALTAQNSVEVRAIHAPPAEFVAEQLETVLDDFPVAAAKTGMLFSAGIIAAVAGVLRARKSFPLVVDPVCVSQTGHALLQEDAVQVLRSEMLPLADLLTPNRPEAELLAGLPLAGEADVARVAGRLLDLGAGAVLLKGGHMPGHGREIVDYLCLPGREPEPLPMPRLDTRHTHGTGCTLSAAIAAGLGKGQALAEAVRSGRVYLQAALRTGYGLGRGYGPPNHLHPLEGEGRGA
ncbi:MAG: bifunctional hydroxymethylpyrimidine kinase/phosphomethylpyrimidine kinase [Thermodesulfobacteriota bacterium]